MRKAILLLSLLSMIVLIPMHALAVDVASIEKPASLQTLYFEPVEIMVLFEDGAAPETFRAYLNFSHDITDKFVPVENGMQAFVTPEDGLQIKESGEFFFSGLNLLTTTTRSETGRRDSDARIFQVKEGGDRDTVILTVLQTSDLHHHAVGYGPFLDYTPDTLNNDGVTGGYARIATVINQIRTEQESRNVPVMLFDSGDFLMGTNYDLTAANPIAFQFFTMMGYDAVTLGNHEFDWSPAGLAMLLSNAVSNGFTAPVIATNMVTDSKDDADDEIEYFKAIGTITDKKVITLENGLKVGLLGLMGEDADEKSPVAPPVTFDHDYDFIQSKVDELKNNDQAQLIIALSHAGVNDDGEGDDANLANGVDGIDLIASGHEHTATYKAFDEAGTLIFSPGAYGKYVSRVDVAYSESEGRIVDSKFELIPVDDAIPGDPYVQGMVEMYNDEINAAIAPLGVALGSPISWTDFSLTLRSLQESGLGNMIADASRTIASQLVLGSSDPTPFTFSVVPSGVIRHSLVPGNTGYIAFADIYNTLPLGISPDADQPMPGYPLMSVYLTAAEIRNVLEAGLTLSRQLGSDYFLNFSGVRVEYDINMAGYLQGVTSVKLCGNAVPAAYGGDEDLFCTGCDTELDLAGSDLYRCVVDLYAMQMMHVITDASYGLLPIVPKHADGSPINMGDQADYMQCRIDAAPDTDTDPATEGVQELKEWMPLLYYLGDVLPTAGFTGIPSYVYGSDGIAMGRIAPPATP